MNDLVIYIIKIMAIQGVFYTIYWLLFKKSIRHTLNRYFLLSALVLSFVIPSINLTQVNRSVSKVRQLNPSIHWILDNSIENELILEPTNNNMIDLAISLLPWLIIAISILFILRSVFYLFTIQKLKKVSELVKNRDFALYKTSQSHPFSFFKNVFIPKVLFGSNAFDQILAHEREHVRRFHSLDRLLLDLIVSLFWFNPFIYCYRNALIEIHEYEADEGVIKQTNDPLGYQEVMFSQLQTPKHTGLVSHFNFQMIKKRIVMMNTKKKPTGWIYLLIAPVTLLMIFAFSNKEAMQPINEVSRSISGLIGPINKMSDYMEKLALESNEPSILPLKTTEKVRVTSGFGKRMHPIMKVEQWHMGIDFACAIGTEVLATASGTVSKAQMKPGGYGKLLVIDHGNDFKTYYSQLSMFKVKQGDQVKKGQVIALSGNSGMSTGPHLHYEVKKGDKRVNPVSYIKNYTFAKKESLKLLSTQKAQLAEHQKANKLRQENLAAQEIKLVKEELDMAKKQHELAAKEMREQTTAFDSVKKRLRVKQAKIKGEVKRVEEVSNQVQKTILKQQETLKILENLKEDLKPLYILDGVAVDELSSELEPKSIERIDVIKGIKAIEKYGEEGKNGVVRIKTNRKSKDPKIQKIQKFQKFKSNY